jgi:hypothetical protein
MPRPPRTRLRPAHARQRSGAKRGAKRQGREGRQRCSHTFSLHTSGEAVIPEQRPPPYGGPAAAQAASGLPEAATSVWRRKAPSGKRVHPVCGESPDTALHAPQEGRVLVRRARFVVDAPWRRCRPRATGWATHCLTPTRPLWTLAGRPRDFPRPNCVVEHVRSPAGKGPATNSDAERPLSRATVDLHFRHPLPVGDIPLSAWQRRPM